MSDDDSSIASWESCVDSFAVLCESLRVKDPSVTVVSRTDIRRTLPLTNQHARRLGKSLRGNPHVTELQLRICRLVEEENVDEDNDSIAHLLRFIRNSRALLKVCLAGETFYPDRPHVPPSILRRFFLALAENTAIKVLVLWYLRLQPGGFDVLMKKTQSLKTLFVESCHFASVVARDNMAEAVGENQSLERLEIKIGSVDFIEPVLLRLGSHPRLRELRLQWFHYDQRPSHMEALACALRSSNTLELLELGGCAFNKDKVEHLLEGI